MRKFCESVRAGEEEADACAKQTDRAREQHVAETAEDAAGFQERENLKIERRKSRQSAQEPHRDEKAELLMRKEKRLAVQETAHRADGQAAQRIHRESTGNGRPKDARGKQAGAIAQPRAEPTTDENGCQIEQRHSE